MCRNFPKLLTAPAEAIANAKKKASYGDALGTLIVDGIITAIAAAIVLTQMGVTGQTLGMAVVSLFVLTFIGGLFVGLLAKLVINNLGGSGNYLKGLTASAYTLAAPSVGALIAAIAIVAKVQWISPIVGIIALALAIGLGGATLYRSIKELFSTDMITALVAVGILTLALGMSFQVMWPMLGLGAPTALTALA